MWRRLVAIGLIVCAVPATAPAQGEAPHDPVQTWLTGVTRKIMASAHRITSGPKGESRAVIGFVVRRDGTIEEAHVATTSGNAAFDETALATVRRAAPFAAIPPEANRDSFALNQAIRFVDRQRRPAPPKTTAPTKPAPNEPAPPKP